MAWQPHQRILPQVTVSLGARVGSGQQRVLGMVSEGLCPSHHAVLGASVIPTSRRSSDK